MRVRNLAIRPDIEVAPGFLERLVAHLPSDADPTLTILKGHLLVEEVIASTVGHYCAVPNRLGDRLGFAIKLRLAEALTGFAKAEPVWKACAALNDLRNKVAHQIEHPEFAAKVGKFIRAARAVDVQDAMSDASVSHVSELARAILALISALHHMEQVARNTVVLTADHPLAFEPDAELFEPVVVKPVRRAE